MFFSTLLQRGNPIMTIDTTRRTNPMPDLIYEKHEAEHYATFTMNRPDRLNALGRELSILQQEALDDFAEDPKMWVAILTGTGRAFSAGADLKEMAQRNKDTAEIEERYGRGEIDAGQRKEALKAWSRPMGPGLFSQCPKPIIAAINGLAYGGGMERSMDCDIRIASTEATFGLPEVKRGILAGYGIQHFARVASFGDAIYFVLTGEAMSAEEALRIGFVREVVEPDRLMPRAIEIAKAISANAPLAVQASKKVMHHWRRFAMEESQKFTDSIYAGIRASEDAKEGPRAFAEKRPAQWKAR